MCNNWPDLTIRVWGAMGGLIGNTVIICGGETSYYGIVSVEKCYSLTSEKATLVTHMSVGRTLAASIIFNHKALWVTGGYLELTLYPIASTEYITVTGTMLGPDLPMALYSHAMVAINSTCSMVIGGLNSNAPYGSPDGHYLASTFFYDHNGGEWINGPNLMQARGSHAAGFVTDEVTDEHFVAVTGGDYGNILDSTEILQDGEWVQGKTNNIRCHLL